MNVEGSTCSICKQGMFHLSPSNKDGCLSCFCMGVTQQCSSSNHYRDVVGFSPAPILIFSRIIIQSVCWHFFPFRYLPRSHQETIKASLLWIASAPTALTAASLSRCPQREHSCHTQTSTTLDRNLTTGSYPTTIREIR